MLISQNNNQQNHPQIEALFICLFIQQNEIDNVNEFNDRC